MWFQVKIAGFGLTVNPVDYDLKKKLKKTYFVVNSSTNAAFCPNLSCDTKQTHRLLLYRTVCLSPVNSNANGRQRGRSLHAVAAKYYRIDTVFVLSLLLACVASSASTPHAVNTVRPAAKDRKTLRTRKKRSSPQIHAHPGTNDEQPCDAHFPRLYVTLILSRLARYRSRNTPVVRTAVKSLVRRENVNVRINYTKTKFHGYIPSRRNQRSN